MANETHDGQSGLSDYPIYKGDYRQTDDIRPIRYAPLETAPKSIFDHLKQEAAKYPTQNVIDEAASTDARLNEVPNTKEERAKARDEMIKWILGMRTRLPDDDNEEPIPDSNEVLQQRLILMNMIHWEVTNAV